MWIWARSKFDTILLALLVLYLWHAASPEAHEAFGALLLAMTGSRSTPKENP